MLPTLPRVNANEEGEDDRDENDTDDIRMLANERTHYARLFDTPLASSSRDRTQVDDKSGGGGGWDDSTSSYFLSHHPREPKIPHHGDSIPVIYTNNPLTVEHWLQDNVPSEGVTLGFDVESVAFPGNDSCCGPATVQLATRRSSLVVQLVGPHRGAGGNPGRRRQSSSTWTQTCLPLLEAVLADPSILKAGVGIDEDIAELYYGVLSETPGYAEEEWPLLLHAKSRLDLRGIGLTSAGRTPGLKHLAATVLGVDLPGKTRRMATSNWANVPLTDAQVSYGARDAWIGAAVVEELCHRDPITFDRNALIDRLSAWQWPITTVLGRSQERKNARRAVKDIIEEARETMKEVNLPDPSSDCHPVEGEGGTPPSSKEKRSRRNRRSSQDDEVKIHLPDEVKVELARLREVVKNTAPQRPLIFDVDNLGITMARADSGEVPKQNCR